VSWAHGLSADQLAGLSLPVGDDGIIVGVDSKARPAVLGIHHPLPYEIVLIGGVWTAWVLALRAVGTGVRVAVETGRPGMWTRLAEAANGVAAGTGGLELMTLHEVGRVPPLGPTLASPVLVVRDCGIRPPCGRVASAPWQPVLTLLPYLSPAAPRLLERAALVGLQRVSPEEAGRLAAILGLPEPQAEALPVLSEDATLWCTRRARQLVRLVPTDSETGLLGNASRLDLNGTS
jgi:ESX secretion system protein EccE